MATRSGAIISLSVQLNSTRANSTAHLFELSMVLPTFARPSKGHLAAFDFLLKADRPFTSEDFRLECSSRMDREIPAGTARSYLRAFTEYGVLEIIPQYPANSWRLKDGWEATKAIKRLEAVYYC